MLALCLILAGYVAGWASCLLGRYLIRRYDARREYLSHRAAQELVLRTKRDIRRGELCSYRLPG